MVDADCLVAGTLTREGSTTQIIDLWRDGEIELVVCPQLLAEVRKTLLDTRIARKYGITHADIDAFLGQLRDEGVPFEDPDQPPRAVPADPNDDYLIALALTSGADFFVTRDRHFDDVHIAGLRIITPGRVTRELR